MRSAGSIPRSAWDRLLELLQAIGKGRRVLAG
jgi:hypothetical protein